MESVFVIGGGPYRNKNKPVAARANTKTMLIKNENRGFIILSLAIILDSD